MLIEQLGGSAPPTTAVLRMKNSALPSLARLRSPSHPAPTSSAPERKVLARNAGFDAEHDMQYDAKSIS
jgi:hypothetical protein